MIHYDSKLKFFLFLVIAVVFNLCFCLYFFNISNTLSSEKMELSEDELEGSSMQEKLEEALVQFSNMTEKYNLYVDVCETAIKNLTIQLETAKLPPNGYRKDASFFAKPILEVNSSFSDAWSKNPMSDDFEPYSEWQSNIIPHILVLIGTACHDYVVLHIRQFLVYNDVMHVLAVPQCHEKYQAAGATVHNISDYMASANSFDRLYPRTLPNGHSTGSRRAFEVSCFQRWYIIRDFMEKKKIARVFSADADTLIFINITEHILKYYANDKIILIWDYPTVTNSYISFDYEGITDMLSFFDYFFNNINKYLPNAEEGNYYLYLNDMNLSKIYGIKAICGSNWLNCSLLRASAVPKTHNAFYNMAYVFQPRLAFLVEKVASIIPSSWTDVSKSPISFDNNIASPLSSYESVGTVKRVTFYNGDAYLTLKAQACPKSAERFSWSKNITDCSIRTLGLHFYSQFKGLMKNYMLTQKFAGNASYCSCQAEDCANCRDLS